MDREFIQDYLSTMESRAVILEPKELDKAIIGFAQVNGETVLCYGVDELIDAFSGMGMSADDAIDMVHNDTIPAVEGLDGAPIFIDKF